MAQLSACQKIQRELDFFDKLRREAQLFVFPAFYIMHDFFKTV